ncbi:MAG: 50S ribosomal protein L16 [Acidilobaceae archaeon]
MPLKPARCYTHFSGPPYTRVEYIAGAPPPKITKFELGNREVLQSALLKAELVAEEAGNVRDNALEALRVIVNKNLTRSLGEANYFMRVRTYPHHVLREHKMMAFAGADRLQEGMRRAFGKPVGRAARVYPGDVLIEVWVSSQVGNVGNVEEKVKEALKVGASKLPIPTRIVVHNLQNAK